MIVFSDGFLHLSAQDHKEHGSEEKTEECDPDHSVENSCAESLTNFSPWSASNHKGKHPELKDKVVVPDVAAFNEIYQNMTGKFEYLDITSMFSMDQIKHTTSLPVTYAK